VSRKGLLWGKKRCAGWGERVFSFFGGFKKPPKNEIFFPLFFGVIAYVNKKTRPEGRVFCFQGLV